MGSNVAADVPDFVVQVDGYTAFGIEALVMQTKYALAGDELLGFGSFAVFSQIHPTVAIQSY